MKTLTEIQPQFPATVRPYCFCSDDVCSCLSAQVPSSEGGKGSRPGVRGSQRDLDGFSGETHLLFGLICIRPTCRKSYWI